MEREQGQQDLPAGPGNRDRQQEDDIEQGAGVDRDDEQQVDAQNQQPDQEDEQEEE